ncbi:hypothetical protein Daus18300_005620 [Diaporthe australafricana]|uniref:BZIP domain-containing protein n=1 Tax=Diaporthe australafricana TaxID=127596 RepID=A0ABR3X0L9_9PEZI
MALKGLNNPVLVHMRLSSIYMNPPPPVFVQSHALDRYPLYSSADAMQEQGPSRLPPGDNRIWVKDVDDWLAITNRQERRRIQNRRNQRALRAKKKGPPPNANTEAEDDGELMLPSRAGQTHDPQRVEITEATIQRFESFATRSYTARIGALSILPSLSQYNFVKALFANMEVLGLSDDEMDDEALSPFNSNVVSGPSRLTAVRPAELLPAALQPTELQHSTMHHLWIDLLPMPAMRENIFRRDADSFDEEELCHAMRGQAPVHNPGLLVWSDPWDPTGWEVTEDFVASWPWVVIGCADLLRSTNAWRARRGERPLFHSSP